MAQPWQIPNFQCTAHSKRTKLRCGGIACKGKKTCYFHGGAKGSGRPIIHGRYSKALKLHPDVLAYYEQYKTDPRITETLNEIALLRAKLAHWMDREPGASALDPASLNIIRSFLDSISKLAERKHKIDYGETVTIREHDFQTLASEVIHIVREVYGDQDEHWERFAAALSKLVTPRSAGNG